MSARPDFWNAENAAAFGDAEVARRYRHRAPYARAAIVRVLSLVDPSAPIVLDLGAGTGNLARELAPHVGRVDAIDPSEAMIAQGQDLPNGRSASLRWINSAAEDAPLAGPYGLATAGTSLHWMDWDVLMPRVRSVLTSTAVLAIVEVEDPLWTADGAVKEVIVRHSAYKGLWRRVDLVATLIERGRFIKVGAETFAETFRQTVDELTDGLLSSSSLSVARIGAESARTFADEMRAVAPRDADGLVTRQVTTGVVWGRPS